MKTFLETRENDDQYLFTHLLKKGVDIRYIQKLLGHKGLETTQIYLQVSTPKLQEINNPLDDL